MMSNTTAGITNNTPLLFLTACQLDINLRIRVDTYLNVMLDFTVICPGKTDTKLTSADGSTQKYYKLPALWNLRDDGNIRLVA